MKLPNHKPVIWKQKRKEIKAKEVVLQYQLSMQFLTFFSCHGSFLCMDWNTWWWINPIQTYPCGRVKIQMGEALKRLWWKCFPQLCWRWAAAALWRFLDCCRSNFRFLLWSELWNWTWLRRREEAKRSRICAYNYYSLLAFRLFCFAHTKKKEGKNIQQRQFMLLWHGW